MRPPVVFLLSALSLAFGSALVQLLLGSDPLVVLYVLVGMGAVCALAVWRPFAFGTWFAAYFLLQLYGIAWIAKTLVLLRFESGLLVPASSVGWATLFVLTACALACIWERVSPEAPRLETLYGDPGAWNWLGTGLLLMGELAHALAYLTHTEAAGSFGGFDPLKRFSLAATCLLTSAAVARGRIMSVPLAIALVLGAVDALITNEKSELFLRATAFGLTISASALPLRRKLAFGALLPFGFAVMNGLLFPAIHATREFKDQNLPINERITLVKSALVADKEDAQYLKTSEGNIWNENVNFLPTENWFLMRFGSVAYLDVTLKFGRPAVQPTSLLGFAGMGINQALPLGLFGPKDEFSLADQLWAKLDSRIEPGGFITMGSYASARLLFGSFTGYVVTSAMFLVIGLLVVRIYGNDVRRPLTMFIFVGTVYTLIDGDLADMSSYLIRFFWQDLLVLVAAALALRMWHQVRTAEQ